MRAFELRQAAVPYTFRPNPSATRDWTAGYGVDCQIGSSSPICAQVHSLDRSSAHHEVAAVVARRFWIVAVLVMAVAGACGGGDDDAASPTTTAIDDATTTTATTTASTTSTTEVDTTEADVTAAYEAASQAFTDAGQIPDPDFPALIETHIDPMLNQRRGVLTQLRVNGAVFRFPEPSVSSVEVDSFELRDSTTAVIGVCVVDDGERYDVATGALLTDGQPGTTHFTAALSNVAGRWLLTEQLLDEEWPGVAGCAVD